MPNKESKIRIPSNPWEGLHSRTQSALSIPRDERIFNSCVGFIQRFMSNLEKLPGIPEQLYRIRHCNLSAEISLKKELFGIVRKYLNAALKLNEDTMSGAKFLQDVFRMQEVNEVRYKDELIASIVDHLTHSATRSPESVLSKIDRNLRKHLPLSYRTLCGKQIRGLTSGKLESFKTLNIKLKGLKASFRSETHLARPPVRGKTRLRLK